ncbi:hypothetical protein [Frigoribacterium sp. SL97]|uniref:hypothetical protein n=1 Tax=Frigoribacterium sp. SL97 TaxID=2994664 RepID=UPI00226E4B2D|nr:hypothetical protein [Frigoribacterium sp. SL97]WAC50244.1 hypothetical protein OVA02_10115 [Frigoribacterium sp. SL97]
MTNFNESEHPRAADGAFTEKRQSEPQVSLTSREVFEQRLRTTSTEAGLGGVMPQILDVVHDRENVSQEDLMDLEAGDITALYDDHIAPAIDAAEFDLSNRTATAEASDVRAHLTRVAREAGLEVMGEVLSVLRDRETVSDSTFGALTADDITALYEEHISAGIDDAERELQGSN